MIQRFRTVIPHVLYRGSAPSPNDIKILKEKYGIKKIVSLDETSGNRINRVCKLLNIEHVKMYIEDDKKTLLHFLTQNLKKLFLEGGPTFVHCRAGKDRTGLACALIECKYLGENPEKAISKAKALGFGVGLPKTTISLYEKIIRSCKKSKDQNSADIVSNERTYVGDNRDSFLDEVHRGDFSMQLDYTKRYPMDMVYNPINDQAQTRENYNNNEALYEGTESTAPQVGIYNNDAGIMGGGPVINSGGFIYE